MSTREEWRAEYARRNADVTYSMCEVHDAAGECTTECVNLLYGMGEGPPSVDFDPTGCSYPQERAFEAPLLDTKHRRVYYATVHEWDTAEHGQVTAHVAAETDTTLDLVLFYRSERLVYDDPEKSRHINDTHLHRIEAGTRLTVPKATTEQLTKET